MRFIKTFHARQSLTLILRNKPRFVDPLRIKHLEDFEKMSLHFIQMLHFIQLRILDEMRHLDEMKLLDEMKHRNFRPREKW